MLVVLQSFYMSLYVLVFAHRITQNYPRGFAEFFGHIIVSRCLRLPLLSFIGCCVRRCCLR